MFAIVFSLLMEVPCPASYSLSFPGSGEKTPGGVAARPIKVI